MCTAGKLACPAMARTLERSRGLDVNLQNGAQQREYAAIAGRIAGDGPGRLLDWGCGWGQVSALLLERGVDVTSFDWAEGAPEAEVQLEKFPHISAFRSSQPVALPYADDSFDSVLSCGVLEHVHDADASLEELKRVMRPGATFYVYKLPNRFSYLEAVARLLGAYYHGKLPNDEIYTMRSARERLERHGYAVSEARTANMLPLTVGGDALGAQIWSANRTLSRIPLLNLLATNVELVATAP
jgi:ubiquinone/menaquinone biosynthesis C-methylase UbiE